MFNRSLTPFSTMTIHQNHHPTKTRQKEPNEACQSVIHVRRRCGYRTMGNRLDLGRLSYGLVRAEAALRVHQMGGEDGVDEGRLSESSLPCIPKDTPFVSSSVPTEFTGRQRAWEGERMRPNNAPAHRRLHSLPLDVSSQPPLPMLLTRPKRLQSDALTDEDDIELETTLQELVLDLLGDRVETDVGLGADFFSHFRAVGVAGVLRSHFRIHID